MRRRGSAGFPLARAVVAALAVLVVLLAAGCGEQGQDGASATDPTTPASTSTETGEPQEPESTGTTTPTDAESTPAAPAPRSCRDQWRAGQTLPTVYQGCVSRGRTIRPRVRSCSSGQSLVEFGTRFYAVPGHRVVDVGSLDSKKYQRVLDICQG